MLRSRTATTAPLEMKLPAIFTLNTMPTDDALKDPLRAKHIRLNYLSHHINHDLFYPPQVLENQDASIITAVNRFDCKIVEVWLNNNVTPENLAANKELKFCLRAMLSQALISSQATDANKDQQLLMVRHILQYCIANGYNILKDSSLVVWPQGAGKVVTLINYYSFLFLAFRFQAYHVIPLLYQLGHAALPEQQITELEKSLPTKTFHVSIALLIYYQPLSEQFERLIMSHVFDRTTTWFSNAANERYPQIINIMNLLLHYSNYFAHGLFNGGTKRLEQVYEEFWQKPIELNPADDSDASSVDTYSHGLSPSHFYPGQNILKNIAASGIDEASAKAFRQTFYDYVTKQPRVMDEFQLHRNLRREELEVPPALATAIASKPPLADTSVSYATAAHVKKQPRLVTYDQVTATLLIAANIHAQQDQNLSATIVDTVNHKALFEQKFDSLAQQATITTITALHLDKDADQKAGAQDRILIDPKLMLTSIIHKKMRLPKQDVEKSPSALQSLWGNLTVPVCKVGRSS